MLTWGNKTQTVVVAECLYVIVIVYYLLLCEYSVCDVLVSDLIRKRDNALRHLPHIVPPTA